MYINCIYINVICMYSIDYIQSEITTTINLKFEFFKYFIIYIIINLEI